MKSIKKFASHIGHGITFRHFFLLHVSVVLWLSVDMDRRICEIFRRGIASCSYEWPGYSIRHYLHLLDDISF
ncbi:hypothetical protein ECG_08806 [Echinococcus granulosus]|nr:hypothetical protein ECG_08806 [Echinococcus granulosus]